jgi:hypothetical protein
MTVGANQNALLEAASDFVVDELTTKAFSSGFT